MFIRHQPASDIAIVGNLYIGNTDWNPLFEGDLGAAMVNHLIHDPGKRVIQFGCVPSQWQGREVRCAALTTTTQPVGALRWS